MSNEKIIESYKIIERFITMLDKIKFTCEQEYELCEANVVLSEDDYNRFQDIMLAKVVANERN